MSAKFYTLLTAIGAAKLANATALGVPLKITQMAVGDGGGVLPTPSAQQTKLVGEQRRAALNQLYIDPQNASQIIAEQVIPADEGGWWIREIGLFDDSGSLIAVGNCAESYKPLLSEGSGRTQTVRMILITRSTANLTLKIDPTTVLATRKYVDDKAIELSAYVDNEIAKHIADQQGIITSLDIGSITFSDTEVGLAGTKNGEYFRVPQGPESNVAFIYYQNSSGVAKEVAKLPGKITQDSLLKVLPQIHEDSALVALGVDDAGHVPLWLDNGRFEAADVTEGFAAKVIDKAGLTGIAEQAQVASTLVPAFVDEAGNVPLWFENGKLGAAGVTEEFSNKVLDKAGLNNVIDSEAIASTLVPLFVDAKGNVPLWLDKGMLAAGDVTQSFADLVGKKLGVVGSGSDWKLTDARSLYGFRLKKAKLIQGESVKLNVGFVGDSWSEYHRMPLNLYGRLVSEFGEAAGGGWLQFITDSLSNWLDMTVKTDGWTLYAARNTWTPSSHGCGVDGYANYTTTTTATMQVTNIKASNMNLYYFDEDGSFRYAIDGGTPVTVTGGNTKTVKKITITGMSNSAQTLSIDTVGNTGTVSILGAYLSSSDKGIVVNKMGCGGTVSGQHLRILDQIPNFTPDLDLDLIILNLGVNDYLQNREPSEYSLNIGKIIDAYKTALPNVGFILVSPAQVNADSQYKMTDYRDAMKQIAKDKGVEWFGFYDDMPSDYSAGNALGAYQDNYHLSDIGAEAYITPIYQNFIKQ